MQNSKIVLQFDNKQQLNSPCYNTGLMNGLISPKVVLSVRKEHKSGSDDHSSNVLDNDQLKDKFKIDEQQSKKAEAPIAKSFMAALEQSPETKLTMNTFAPPPLSVDIDKLNMPPPPATGVSPHAPFTPSSALQMGGLRSPP